MPRGCASTIMSSRRGAWLDRWHTTRQSDHFPQDSGKSCFTFTSQPVLLHPPIKPHTIPHADLPGLHMVSAFSMAQQRFLALGGGHGDFTGGWFRSGFLGLHHSRRHGHFLPAYCRRVSSLAPFPPNFCVLTLVVIGDAEVHSDVRQLVLGIFASLLHKVHVIWSDLYLFARQIFSLRL